MEINQAEQSRKKEIKEIKKKNKSTWRDFWDNIRHTNICIICICIMEVSEGEKKHKSKQKLFEEIKAETLPNLGEKTDTEVQEAPSLK